MESRVLSALSFSDKSGIASTRFPERVLSSSLVSQNPDFSSKNTSRERFGLDSAIRRI